MTVCINGVVGPYFQNGKGLRQGDALSLLLFNFVVDVLSAILVKATDVGHISGVLVNLIPGGITQLRYVDDTTILIEKNDLYLETLKFLLLYFTSIKYPKEREIEC